jgi:hypothetical protein
MLQASSEDDDDFDVVTEEQKEDIDLWNAEHGTNNIRGTSLYYFAVFCSRSIALQNVA